MPWSSQKDGVLPPNCESSKDIVQHHKHKAAMHGACIQEAINVGSVDDYGWIGGFGIVFIDGELFGGIDG